MLLYIKMYVYLNDWKIARKITLNVSRKIVKCDTTEYLQFKVEMEGFFFLKKASFTNYGELTRAESFFMSVTARVLRTLLLDNEVKMFLKVTLVNGKLLTQFVLASRTVSHKTCVGP